MSIVVNSFILTIINLASILTGFAIYYLTKSPNQIAVQAVSACVISIVFYMAWHFLSYRFVPKLLVKSKTNLFLVFILSLLWTPLVFVPLHYLSQGYITSWSNINGIWMFQAPTNALILFLYNRNSVLLKLADLLKRS
jgi:hypothetical protein